MFKEAYLKAYSSYKNKFNCENEVQILFHVISKFQKV
ncbi:Protein CBG25840 [Caenorhabditis briggsae]|uniref:Protein CBG25840 n=1 Tax=Caenorhabditis briggsae TaxID=6238 RepID=B6IHB1_CAEBR|nr:Protein CBG25840 [Caenorhabditis briggsae]CAR99291.1 Protein CBG25840 [Caenorhabditis briggsae]